MRMTDPFQAGTELLMQQNKPADELHIDLTLIADAGLSMADFWQRLADDAHDVDLLLEEALPPRLQQKFRSLRVRIIACRDLYMHASALQFGAFHPLPTEADALQADCLSILTEGGGPQQKSTLEALCCAIQSSWLRRECDVRHVVAVITDSAAYLPEEPMRRIDSEYEASIARFLPAHGVGMPRTMEDMRRLWRDGAGAIDNLHSRLLIIAPPVRPWKELHRWPRTTLQLMPERSIRSMNTVQLFDAIGKII